MKYRTGWSSHLPVLAKVLRVTKGSVLELGMGIFSTPFLHWMCLADGRRELFSYESNERYFKEQRLFSRGFHKIELVKDWDKIDIDKPWCVAFIDHEAERRKIEIRRLSWHARYLVVHDTQPQAEQEYGYNEIYPLFKYRRDYKFSRANTSVLSNFKDLSELDA